MRNLFITALLAISTTSFAQYDPEALAVLDAMSTKYKQTEAFKATFMQQLTNKEAGLDESLTMEITVKGAMYVLDVAGQKIFNNGSDIYTFSEELGEVTISPYEAEEAEINPSNVYDLYKEGFKYALLSKMENGVRVIELDPESRERSYFKIRMNINSKDEIESFIVFEKTGNRYTYSIQGFEEITVGDDFFTFDASKYPDVEVIDFR
ncbi:MAG: outer membrane lipoprotein carrier protein LolA [Cyclobacteriaceae bacterium]